MAYDPWGKRRNTNGLIDATDSINGLTTDRGYTFHEHLDEMGIIHMNGRIYDPLIGRFMSADPFIQATYNLKSFNRYSYVWNNPMKLFDLDGYNARDDSRSSAGYGSSNGDHDPTGVGGVSDGEGGQIGGNSGSRGTGPSKIPTTNSTQAPPSDRVASTGFWSELGDKYRSCDACVKITEELLPVGMGIRLGTKKI
jgi:RHS repeat-associated protein